MLGLSDKALCAEARSMAHALRETDPPTSRLLVIMADRIEALLKRGRK